MKSPIHELRKKSNKNLVSKTVKLLSAFFLVALVSCNNSDSDNDNVPTTIDGTWRLASVTGGIAGTHDEFNGEITWTFDNNGNVAVSNSNTDDTKVDFMDTGDYLYNFAPNPSTPESCSEAMFIDGVSYGCYSIDDNTMVLNQVENDGYEVTLIKIGPVTNF